MNDLSKWRGGSGRTPAREEPVSDVADELEAALTNRCIAAINEAVEGLRKVGLDFRPTQQEAASRQEVIAEPAKTADTPAHSGRDDSDAEFLALAHSLANPTRNTEKIQTNYQFGPKRQDALWQSRESAPLRDVAPEAPPVAPAIAKAPIAEIAPVKVLPAEAAIAQPVEEPPKPSQPEITARRGNDSDPADEMKSRPGRPLPRTIDNDNGPLKENDRRPTVRDGGGGNGTPTDGGGGEGGGGGKHTFHKRMGPVNFAASLRNGMAVVRRNMMIVIAFTIAINVLVLAIPIYLFQISDRVLTSRSQDTLVMLTIAVLGAIILQVVLDSIRRFILMRTAVEMEVQLGAPILSAAARASLHGSGRDYQVLSDLQQLRAFIVSGTLISFLDAPLMPFFVVVVYIIQPQLGLIVIMCCVVLFLIAYLNQKATSQPFSEANAFLSRANFHLDSMSRNSQIINALAMIPEAVKMWGREIAGSLKSQVYAQDRSIIFTGASKAVRMFTQVALLGWGAHLSMDGELTGGMVIAASIISGRALAPVEGAIEGWNQLNHSRAAYGRIKQLLVNSPLNFPRLRLPNPEGRLDVERILFVPPPQKRVILNGISFSLNKGESLAVIGNSGSGKTTLGKMLVGSIVPTSGNVRLDLMDLRNWDQRQFGESIGYLPQDVQLFPGTIKANISRMRDDVEDSAIFEAAVLADVHELIASFPQGYETIVAADGAPLSGGQKQRIALARAFFGNPKFVVLDEPNSNLDSNGEAALARALVHAKKQGITTVTITQRPALLQCVDKIMVLNEGTVAMFGARNDVLAAIGAKPKDEKSAPRIAGE